MTTAAKKAAPKPKAAKRDASLCHFGGGSYGSSATSKKCPDKLVEGKQLCQRHEALWKVEAKKRADAKKAAAPKAPTAPKSAGSSPKAVKSTKTVAKNSGGATRRSVPPVQLHPAPVPVSRVNMPEPAMMQLVAVEG